MTKTTKRAIAIRLGPFLVAVVVSLVLTFAHSTYVNRQGGFIWAAHEGEISRMRFLYALGVDVNEPACRYRNCITPLVNAGWGGHPEAIRFLLDRGADVNKSGKFGKTALMMAAYYGDEDSVKLLLSRGADVNATGTDGITALSLAEEQGHRTIIDLLRSVSSGGREEVKHLGRVIER